MLQPADLQLLRQFYAIHAPTYHEWPMFTFIREYVTTHIPDTKVRVDKWENLYNKL